MSRIANKQIFEIEAKINDLYYGKLVAMSDLDSAGAGFEHEKSDFMSSNFGYGQAQQRMLTHEMSQQRDEELRDYIQLKIESLQIHAGDLEEFFNKNSGDLTSSAAIGQPGRSSSNDKVVYWGKKIQQLRQKINGLPQSLQRAIKNRQRLRQQMQQ
mmetsp:Transcript_1967/g.3446  ORF Transcript_1967/g.3446 Transcript_1967/m.3446 type:complete len:156 (-) Transcript_1967:513-980(-)